MKMVFCIDPIMVKIYDHPIWSVSLFGNTLVGIFNLVQYLIITLFNKYFGCLAFGCYICTHNVFTLENNPLIWSLFCIHISFSNIEVTLLFAVRPTLWDLIHACSDSTLLVVYSSYILIPKIVGRIEKDGWSMTWFFIQWSAFSTCSWQFFWQSLYSIVSLTSLLR